MGLPPLPQVEPPQPKYHALLGMIRDKGCRLGVVYYAYEASHFLKLGGVETGRYGKYKGKGGGNDLNNSPGFGGWCFGGNPIPPGSVIVLNVQM